MKKRLQRLYLLVLIGVIGIIGMMVLSSCTNESKDDVIKLSNSLGEAVCELDIDEVEELFYKPDSDKVGSLKTLVDFHNPYTYSIDEDLIFSCIADSLEYEFDEDSVEVSRKDKSGSADITFTMVDYLSIYEDNSFSSASEFFDELSSSNKTISFDIKLKFVLNDKEWLIKKNGFDDIYDMYESIADNSFSYGDDLSSCSSTISWAYEEDEDDYGVPIYYPISEFMNPYILFDEYVNTDDMYFIITFNGDAYTFDYPLVGDIKLYPSDFDMEYFVEGLYAITFYDNDDDIINTSFCYVDFPEFDGECELFWYFADDRGNNGEDAIYVEHCNVIDLDWTNCPNYSLVFYEVYYEGSLVYTSTYGTYSGYYGDYQGAEFVDGYLSPGEYEIVFYYGFEEACRGNAFVNMGETPHSTIGPLELASYQYDSTTFFYGLYETSVDSVDYLDPEGFYDSENSIYSYGATEIGAVFTVNDSNPYSEFFVWCDFCPYDDILALNEAVNNDEDYEHFFTEIDMESIHLVDNQFTLSYQSESPIERGLYIFVLRGIGSDGSINYTISLTCYVY